MLINTGYKIFKDDRKRVKRLKDPKRVKKLKELIQRVVDMKTIKNVTKGKLKCNPNIKS